MTINEAVLAATLGGALALRRTDIGHLAPGADAVVLEAPSPAHLIYGVPLTAELGPASISLTLTERGRSKPGGLGEPASI